MTPYSDVMVTSVICWYDVLVCGKWKILADDVIVQYVHIVALKRQCIGLGRILYTNENDMICHHLLCNTSASVTRLDCVLYNSMAWIHIWICSSMFNIVNNPSSLFPIPLTYTIKSYDIFIKFHVCKHILSTHCKLFLVEFIFNIFIFKLNEFKWTFIFALILLYWYSVKPSLQRHYTFDMLLHIGYWLLWLVTVMMYGRFHSRLLNVIRH